MVVYIVVRVDDVGNAIQSEHELPGAAFALMGACAGGGWASVIVKKRAYEGGNWTDVVLGAWSAPTLRAGVRLGPILPTLATHAFRLSGIWHKVCQEAGTECATTTGRPGC